MKIERVQDFKLDDFTLIGSLPDMGKVGGLVSQHIAKKLDAQLAVKITITDKPWINQKKGLVFVPREQYRITVDEKNKIVIFEGGNQPQEPDTVMKLAETVFCEVQKIGNIKKVISAGGYLPAQPGNKVFGVATTQQALEDLEKQQIFPLSSDVNNITWFNGLILARAKDAGITGIGLFGEITSTDTPQYKAASNIIAKIQKILNVPIDTCEIDQKVVEPKQTKTDGPGIG